LDGVEIGSGPGDRGFQIEFTTTLGLHDLVFMWERDRDGFEYEGKWIEARTYQRRSETEVVFSQSGHCTLRMGYWSSFRIRRVEPRGIGYVPVSKKKMIGLFAVGAALLAIGFATVGR